MDESERRRTKKLMDEALGKQKEDGSTKLKDEVLHGMKQKGDGWSIYKLLCWISPNKLGITIENKEWLLVYFEILINDMLSDLPYKAEILGL